MRRTGSLRRRAPLRVVSDAHIEYQAQLDALRPALARRSCGLCERCRKSPALVAHHRWRRGQGGVNALWNLAHLCVQCHEEVHGHPVVALEDGWLVRPEHGHRLAAAGEGYVDARWRTRHLRVELDGEPVCAFCGTEWPCTGEDG